VVVVRIDLLACLMPVTVYVQVQGMVDSYKGANVDIANIGKGISELLLVRIDPHRVYENLEFEEDQVGYSYRVPLLRPAALCLLTY